MSPPIWDRFALIQWTPLIRPSAIPDLQLCREGWHTMPALPRQEERGAHFAQRMECGMAHVNDEPECFRSARVTPAFRPRTRTITDRVLSRGNRVHRCAL